MERKVTATDARIHFGEVIRRVAEQGEKVIVERAGKPQVAIISIVTYEQMKKAQQQSGWREALAHAVQVGAKIRARRGDRPLTPPEEIIGQVREERNAQFDDLR